MLTVRGLVSEMGLELAAGEDGADAPVRWVHISELLDPTPWLSGGELLLTTGIQLDTEKRQREFARLLSGHHLAGLGFGTGFDHDGLPPALLEEAAGLDFPVFEVPYELPFIALTEKAFTRLVNEQYEVLQRGIAIHKRLERLVLEESGLDEVVRALAAATGGAVSVLSGRGETISSKAFRRQIPEAAMEQVRAEVARRSEELAGSVLAEALTGGLANEELAMRLRPFGIHERLAVLVFDLDDADGAEPLLDRMMSAQGVGALVATRDTLVCALVDAREVEPLSLAASMRDRLADRFGSVRAAASRVSSVPNIRRSFHEARWALEATALGNGVVPPVASYRDLGAFQLLLSLQDDEALRLYCDSVLGPIEQEEGEYGDELLRSLEAFSEENGQWERASRRLYCHRHTLRYRIRRIEQLTGRDLRRAQDRIEFWLAMRGRELVK